MSDEVQNVGQGIGAAVMQGAEQMGKLMLDIAGHAAQKATAGIGALLAMVPGLGEIGEAVASVGKGTTPMVDGHIASAPAPSVTPVKAPSITPAISAEPEMPKTIVLPAVAF